ncbi:MAG: metallophosphoesterase [Patescibacteria group bacterium]
MKLSVIVVFIAIASLIIIAGHLGLYVSWVKFFHISDIRVKRALGITVGILSCSFIVASALTYWKENTLVNAIYGAAGGWLGIVWYLTLATAAVWLVFLVSWLLGQRLPLATVAGVLLAASVVYSIYGIWNAQHPVVKRITVTIPNLPETWRGRTVVQLSDVHLGPVHREKFLQRVVDQVAQMNPDAVFITGDLFDGGGRDLSALVDPLAQLTPPHGIYYITGNHETYVGLDHSLSAVRSVPAIHILRDQLRDVDGLQLLGIDYPLSGTSKDVQPVLALLDRTKPSIVLYHEPKLELVDAIQSAGANLLLAGHTHVGQLWPFNFITNAMYRGEDYGLTQKSGFSLYTSSGIGTWGPPVRTGNRPEIVAITLR